jgi:hypothetical protein
MPCTSLKYPLIKALILQREHDLITRDLHELHIRKVSVAPITSLRLDLVIYTEL